ncbi:MAG: YbaK/EbsC family protein [Actinomycetota bacterium]|nr:YbaK/EbsC family protein [Actinomycetota bacterium]
MVDATHPNCRAVDAALADAGVDGRVRILPEPAPTAARAAEQLGVEVGAIANSLVFTTEGGTAVLVLASGAHRVDTARAARAVGVRRLDRSTPEVVRRSTGQPIGGVAPLGHPVPLPTVVDTALAAYETVWAAGGVPHAVFPTSFSELLRLTGGQPAEVG